MNIRSSFELPPLAQTMTRRTMYADLEQAMDNLRWTQSPEERIAARAKALNINVIELLEADRARTRVVGTLSEPTFQRVVAWAVVGFSLGLLAGAVAAVLR